MKSFAKIVTLSVCLSIVMGTNVEGSLTGTETGNPIQFAANSTNELNYNMLVPGREGQTAPYVLFDSADSSSVTLNFNNDAPGLAFFEYRIDGVSLTPDSTHPVVTGDDIYPGIAVNSGTTNHLETFTASSMVEVRLALGGERDWDFDWTSFSVDSTVIPEPSTLFVWSGIAACVGLVSYRRRRTA